MINEITENQIEKVFHEKFASYLHGEYQSSNMWLEMWEDIFKAWNQIIKTRDSVNEKI